MAYRIGEVSNLSGVSIRALRYYDEIGLLIPSGRSEAGYRLYSNSELTRLQQILFYRALNFSLDDIYRLMTDSSFDREKALLQQRQLLLEQAEQMHAVIEKIDKAINSESHSDEEKIMNTSELKDMFDAFPDVDKDLILEAEKEWGHTEQHRESMRRAKNYSKEDWQELAKVGDAIYEKLGKLYEQNVAADNEQTLDLVNQQRLLIDKWFYPCSAEFYVGLTDMTRSDERYRRNIDEHSEGLAEYLHQGAKALLERQ